MITPPDMTYWHIFIRIAPKVTAVCLPMAVAAVVLQRFLERRAKTKHASEERAVRPAE